MAVAMQARGAAVLVVVGAALLVLAAAQAGAELVVVVGAALVVVRSRRMNVVIVFLLRPLIGEKTSEVFSCHLHVRDREYD